MVEIHIEFFDSFEDMMKAEERARNAADARTQDWQKEIKVGDYFVTDSGYGFPIFGVVLEGYKKHHLKNYRFCECYSIGCPEGEKGDVHVSTMLAKITKEAFEVYHEKGWSYP